MYYTHTIAIEPHSEPRRCCAAVLWLPYAAETRSACAAVENACMRPAQACFLDAEAGLAFGRAREREPGRGRRLGARRGRLRRVRGRRVGDGDAAAEELPRREQQRCDGQQQQVGVVAAAELPSFSKQQQTKTVETFPHAPEHALSPWRGVSNANRRSQKHNAPETPIQEKHPPLRRARDGGRVNTACTQTTPGDGRKREDAERATADGQGQRVLDEAAERAEEQRRGLHEQRHYQVEQQLLVGKT